MTRQIFLLCALVFELNAFAEGPFENVEGVNYLIRGVADPETFGQIFGLGVGYGRVCGSFSSVQDGRPTFIDTRERNLRDAFGYAESGQAKFRARIRGRSIADERGTLQLFHTNTVAPGSRYTGTALDPQQVRILAPDAEPFAITVQPKYVDIDKYTGQFVWQDGDASILLERHSAYSKPRPFERPKVSIENSKPSCRMRTAKCPLTAGAAAAHVGLNVFFGAPAIDDLADQFKGNGTILAVNPTFDAAYEVLVFNTIGMSTYENVDRSRYHYVDTPRGPHWAFYDSEEPTAEFIDGTIIATGEGIQDAFDWWGDSIQNFADNQLGVCRSGLPYNNIPQPGPFWLKASSASVSMASRYTPIPPSVPSAEISSEN